jgi:hypothetical protein
MKDSLCAKTFHAQRNTCVRWKRESGQTILLVALTLVVLIMAAGLAIDMGYLRYHYCPAKAGCANSK